MFQKTIEDQTLQNNFENNELTQSNLEDFWTRDILKKINNNSYYQNEEDLI